MLKTIIQKPFYATCFVSLLLSKELLYWCLVLFLLSISSLGRHLLNIAARMYEHRILSRAFSVGQVKIKNLLVPDYWLSWGLGWVGLGYYVVPLILHDIKLEEVHLTPYHQWFRPQLMHHTRISAERYWCVENVFCRSPKWGWSGVANPLLRDT